MCKRALWTVFLIVALFGIAASAQQKNQRPNASEDDVWGVSQWISVVDVPVVTGAVNDRTRAADGASWFASTITNEKTIKTAVWMTAGLGVYELYVNGKLIGDEILKPGYSHPQKTKYSFTYNITETINKTIGEKNVFSAQVTPGWWADKIVTPYGNDGFIGKKCAFRCVIKVTYDDGSEELFGSNTTNWVAGIAGRVKHASIFDGEKYDAREKEGFECIDDFKAPEINTEFNGQIVPNPGADVHLRYDLALDPIKAYTWEGTECNSDNSYGKVLITKEYTADDIITVSPRQTLVVDFGQNCSAVPSFLFSGKKGTVLTCLPAELLNEVNGDKSSGMDGPEGSVYRENLRIPEVGMRLEYTFAGKEQESFIPHSTFFGYRYLSITATDQVIISDIKSIPISSIIPEMEIGTIKTGNDLVNQLISNTLWSERSNYLSIPTDCPQRNERQGWTADTQVFAETGSFFANTSGFFHKWLQDLRDSQSPTGAYPAVAPFGQNGASLMRVGWADAGIIVPFVIWKQFGDITILENCWNSMEKYMDHISETKYDHNTLKDENGNYQYADWLSFEPLESWSGNYKEGSDIKKEAIDYWDYLGASYWLMDTEYMFYMAGALGKDATKCSEMMKNARNYIRQTFFTPDGKFKSQILNTMQTPALFALRNNILSGVEKERMIANLRNNFDQHDNCLQTGFLGTSILMKTLTENGMSDIAYELLLNEKNPSWLYSVINGATTIWERWDSYIKGVGIANKNMNSFNHYAYGCVCQWIWETVAGISSDPKQPGFKHIIMKPIPDKRLGFIDAEYHSSAGLIKSSWKYEGEKCIWDFTIPNGSTASVTLPGETIAKDYNAGSYSIIITTQQTGVVTTKENGFSVNDNNCFSISGVKYPEKINKGIFIRDKKKYLKKE